MYKFTWDMMIEFELWNVRFSVGRSGQLMLANDPLHRAHPPPGFQFLYQVSCLERKIFASKNGSCICSL